MARINGFSQSNISPTPTRLKQIGITNQKDPAYVSFSDRVKNAMNDVNVKQHVADDATEKVVKGEMGIHEGMLALQEADIAFKLLSQVRSKVMQAYMEIIKMPV